MSASPLKKTQQLTILICHSTPHLCNIHTLQSRDYHGYLEGNKRRQNGDEQWPARGIAALQISNATINQPFFVSQNVQIRY
jgi:hypothetical protein